MVLTEYKRYIDLSLQVYLSEYYVHVNTLDGSI